MDGMVPLWDTKWTNMSQLNQKGQAPSAEGTVNKAILTIQEKGKGISSIQSKRDLTID